MYQCAFRAGGDVCALLTVAAAVQRHRGSEKQLCMEAKGNALMKGAARITNEASPTPTTVLHSNRLQKSYARPQEKTDVNHISRPIPTNLNGSTVALKCTKIGADTSRPAINAAGKHPS